MSNLTILNSQIANLGNLYSLNELHQLSGSENKHAPFRFTRLDTTKELIAEIKRQDPQAQPLKTLRGTQGGTYACEELVLAYAMWISPKFHLVVLRAFIAMHKGQAQQLALPEPEPKISLELTQGEFLRFASTWFALYKCVDLLGNLAKPLEMLGSDFSPRVYGHATEYKTTLGIMQRMLLPIYEQVDIQALPDHNRRALETLRNYKPKGIGAVAKI